MIGEITNLAVKRTPEFKHKISHLRFEFKQIDEILNNVLFLKNFIPSSNYGFLSLWKRFSLNNFIEINVLQ